MATQLASAAEAACDLDFVVTARHDTVPRYLDVSVRFAAEGRRQTVLRGTPEWAGVPDFAAAWSAFGGPGVRVEPLPEPFRQRVHHSDQGDVTVTYRARADLPDAHDGRPQDQTHLYRTQIGADWFQFFGYGVLLVPEHWGDDRTGRFCLTLRQPGHLEAPFLGSHHAGRGEVAKAAVEGSMSQLRHAFYAGGAGWRVRERQLPSGTVAIASRGHFELDEDRYADQVAALVGLHRRFWNDGQQPAQWFVLTPNFQERNVGGTLVHRAAVLHAGPQFGPQSPAFEFLIGHENLHQWFPDRFGARDRDRLADTAHSWFGEGFANHYTHRLLLDSGLWTPQRHAQAMTEVLQRYWRSPAREATAEQIAPRFFSDRDAGQQLYARGELLALRWDRALRRAGHPGLDSVMRSLVLPPGPRSDDEPLAHERVLNALRPLLGTQADDDVRTYVVQGRSIPLDEDLLGPSLRIEWREVPRWVLGLDRASFTARRAIGVDPQGPAYRAGLREGDVLEGWSVHNGDADRDIELWVRRGEEVQRMSYRPVDGTTQTLPVVHLRS